MSTVTQQPVDNPFTRVYDALWNLALRHRDFEARVKPGNRITFADLTDRGPLKPTIAAADLPEVVLTVRSLSSNLNNTSSTSQCTRVYAWMVSTGDYRYSQILAPVEWGLFCAMAGWRTTLTNLKWRNKKFVSRVQLTGGSSGLSDPAQNRNIQGWSTLWSVEVEMNFDHADLEDEINSKENV